jgi:signal peptidase
MDQRRSILNRIGSGLLSLVLVASLLLFGLIALGPHVFGYRTATMLTGSMEPGISPGDVVLSMPRPVADVQLGDVISYHIPVGDHRVETHRIVEVVHGEDGSVSVRTAGDANGGVDPWLATLEGDTVWEMQVVIPQLGTVIRGLRQPVIQEYVFWGALGTAVLIGLGLVWDRTEDEYQAAEWPPVPATPTTARPALPSPLSPTPSADR